MDLAQMHGDEPPSYIGDPASPLYGRSYKALKPSSIAVAKVEVEWYIPPIKGQNSPSLLIDSYHPTIPGGTGMVADWDVARQLAAEIPELMLAGGLNAANVTWAIEKVHPYAVDVSSGVERRPGKKNPTLVRAFIRAAKNSLT
jgi:phosphoribosylanthranilate isomerase